MARTPARALASPKRRDGACRKTRRCRRASRRFYALLKSRAAGRTLDLRDAARQVVALNMRSHRTCRKAKKRYKPQKRMALQQAVRPDRPTVRALIILHTSHWQSSGRFRTQGVPNTPAQRGQHRPRRRVIFQIRAELRAEASIVNLSFCHVSAQSNFLGQHAMVEAESRCAELARRTKGVQIDD